MSQETEFVADTYIEENFNCIQDGLELEQLAQFLCDQIVRPLLDDNMKVVSVIGGPASGKSTIVSSAMRLLRDCLLYTSDAADD